MTQKFNRWLPQVLSTLAFFYLLSALAFNPQDAMAGIKKPKLIVSLVIDQFRADYLTRFESRFLPALSSPEQSPAKAKGTSKGTLGGFQYLMTQGAYYPFAQYDIFQCMTGPGHATILTGSYPYQSGISLNDWFDSKSQKKIYCVEDSKTQLVSSQPEEKPQSGMSPRHLIGSTFGDELKSVHTSSRVISLALKDRAAILMGGHSADLALWLNDKTQQWVSSTYYLSNKPLPAWVTALNQKTGALFQNPFDSSLSPSPAAATLVPQEGSQQAASGSMSPSLSAEDALLEKSKKELLATEQAAEAAIQAYGLGQGETTDVLAVSFSSHDYLGHALGPNQPQMEEITVTEDRIVSRLLNFLNTQIPGGLNEVVITLTADHGAPPHPMWAQAHKIPAGRFSEKELGDRLSEHLETRFGKLEGEKAIAFVKDFNFYFNPNWIQGKKLNLTEVETEGKAFLEKKPEAAFVVTTSDYINRKLPPGILERQILHGYYKGRNGDLIFIPKPFFMPGPNQDANITHLTGYSYDRSVPLILTGHPFKPGVYAQRAEVVDLAPTLSFITQVLAPSLSEGRVLNEALVPLELNPESSRSPLRTGKKLPRT
ncbi:MAG: alkaline phosphatase family protein [Bdellovibrionia bacterium]